MSLKVKLSALIFLFIFSLGLIWAMIIPGNGESPDEAQHIEMVMFLKNNHRLPVFNGDEVGITKTSYTEKRLFGPYYSMAYNSPLNYVAYVYLINNIDYDKTSVLPARVVSSLFIALFALLLFLSLLRISDDVFAATASTIFIALIPQVLFSASYVNIEPVSLFASSLALFAFIHVRHNPKENKLTDFLMFGITLGLLGLCKANYYIVIGYFALIILIDLFTNENKFLLFKNYLFSLVIFALIDSSWWIRNFKLYHDPLILTYIQREIVNKAPDWAWSPVKDGYGFFSIFKIPFFVDGTFKGFYAYLGAMAIILPNLPYIIFLTIIIITLIISLYKKNSRVYGFAFLLVVLIAVAYFIQKNLTNFSPQGRHFFPLLIPLALILFLAQCDLKHKLKKFISLVLISFSLITILYTTLQIINQYYVTGRAFLFKKEIIQNFSWHNFSLNGYRRLLDFIFSYNPEFFRINLFLALLVIIIFSVFFIYLSFLGKNYQ